MLPPSLFGARNERMSPEEGGRDSALAFPTFPLRTEPSFEVIMERKLGHQALHDEWELFLEELL